MKKAQSHRWMVRRSQGAMAMAMAAALVANEANAAPRKRATVGASSIQSHTAPLPVLAAPVNAAAKPPAPPPAPMGVFGAAVPGAGKLVVSLNSAFGNLSGIKMGTRTVSNEYIVTNVPFFLNPRQPVRIVPQNISFRTQILGLSYGVTDDLAVVLTAGMAQKSLEALTFKGTSGILPLGRSYPGTEGITDFTLSGVYRVYRDDVHRVLVNVGFSFPTGSNYATFNNFLLPTGVRQNIRGFYGMQIGAGTFDIMPGIVYAGFIGPWSWGLSYRGRFPLAPNPQGYLWGDLHDISGWGGYTWVPGVTTTLRVNASMQGPIRGFDPEIRGPAVPANPAFYGGQRVELFGGGAISGKLIGYDNWTLAGEAGLPVYQNLNGPQIMKNWQAGISLQYKR